MCQGGQIKVPKSGWRKSQIGLRTPPNPLVPQDGLGLLLVGGKIWFGVDEAG